MGIRVAPGGRGCIGCPIIAAFPGLSGVAMKWLELIPHAFASHHGLFVGLLFL
jgi:hypothetical protein